MGFGWTTEKVAFDWPTLIANKDKEIDRLNKAYIRNLEAAGAELIHERAELEDAPHRSPGRRPHVSTANIVLIATGATPFVPRHLPGHELAITSNEAFHLEALPRRICIVGGGYIAVEFAGIFSGLGVETVLIYRGEQILRGFDDDLRHHLAAEMKKKGIEIRTRADVARDRALRRRRPRHPRRRRRLRRRRRSCSRPAAFPMSSGSASTRSASN